MSNLGSSLGTAIAGTIMVAGITATPERSYALALAVLAALGLAGLVAALALPLGVTPTPQTRPPPIHRPAPSVSTAGGILLFNAWMPSLDSSICRR